MQTLVSEQSETRRELSGRGKPPSRAWAWFADRRIELGLSQEEVGRYAGLSSHGVSNFESGDRIPPLSHIEALSRALRVSEEEMVQQVYRRYKAMQERRNSNARRLDQ